ncbi:hypothetical protein DXG03_000716 [Asterophora parasitica]|uniref:F-box domain-containing protein n=1 Tax=Asterophora parasitica TaxID=117018 RepID=A0A9P7G460_9AGAR|nr:hypothetical protein DXG03_000716 [Asterophora parasitica]
MFTTADRIRSLESELSALRHTVTQLSKSLIDETMPKLRHANQTLAAEVSLLRRENNDLWNEIFQLKGQRLIPDVYFHIIDALADDKPTLKSCALVCRSWHQHVLPHLFRQIFYKSSADRNNPNFTDYLALLRNPDCTIFSHVHTIRFDGKVEHRARFTAPLGYFGDLRQIIEFFAYADKFTSLRRIQFSGLFLNQGQWKILFDSGIGLHVTELKVSHRAFRSMREFTAFVALFKNLLILTLSVDPLPGYDELTYFNDLARAFPPPVTLSNIVLPGSVIQSIVPVTTAPAQAIFQWLYDTQHRGLRAMDLETSQWTTGEIEAFQRYITFLGPELSTITGLVSEGVAACVARGGACRLSLEATIVFAIPMITAISVLPRSLQHLTLYMSGRAEVYNDRPFEDIFVERWTELDGLLSSEKFPVLREVEIALSLPLLRYPVSIEEDLRPLWTQLMPRCVANRLLYVTFIR